MWSVVQEYMRSETMLKFKGVGLDKGVVYIDEKSIVAIRIPGENTLIIQILVGSGGKIDVEREQALEVLRQSGLID